MTITSYTSKNSFSHNPSDEQQVRATINQYFQGHATADPAEMRKAFLPTAHIEGIREGKFVSWTAAM